MIGGYWWNRLGEIEKANSAQVEELEECLHEESENGVCSDCGSEIDWVCRLFGQEG